MAAIHKAAAGVQALISLENGEKNVEN